ncbi:EamA family transporter RarD [Labilibaculum sp. A4]|uniref:EamA family transporter RarD n=1 Tax=Labilibaculum euxinus TaxID=2686357 RepID=UPI000F619FA9|nr:EamA family transporter RarD [Labilibaculum euxinus]MDQ1772531.1 EamA family transporter RarD [Labilibaculum euxinus]MWN78183.1 EamA family transporter RarD [Labilibaculum euxinus]
MEDTKNATMGYVYALQAFLTWGILPIFWKLLSNVSAIEILAHRIFWSFVFLIILLLLTRKKNVWNLLRQKKTRKSLIISSLLIGLNWGLFIYAVNAKQIVEASLGYYINPIVNVILGMIVLNEKLDKLKYIAVLIASTAVIYLTIDYGKFPWISIVLACSFGLYGLTKKTAGIEAISALAVETLILAPFALGYILYKMWIGNGALFTGSISTSGYLMLTGIVTTLPLYWFAKGAQRIPLSALGFMQYIAPTLMLLIGVLIYNEPFRHEQLIAFGLIWIALALYTTSIIRNTRNKIKSAKP